MEIGSEMQLNLADYSEVKEDNIFSYLSGFNTIYLDSGRSAIKALNQLLPSGKILLPSYICKSVIDGFEKREMEFYDMDYKFDIDLAQINKKIHDNPPAVLFIMNYWGNVYNHDTITAIKEQCKKEGIVIIEDTTHSIFTAPITVGDYCVCSLRKWFPIGVGGYFTVGKNFR